MNNMKRIFATKNYEYMKNLIMEKDSSIKLGGLTRKDFEDGERNYVLSIGTVKGHDVILVGGTATDQDTLELFDLGSALVKYGARSLRIICPYFGYSTMERAVSEGEIVIAKTRARLISAIPVASGGNEIVLFDLHSEGIPHYFEGNIVSKHVYGKSFVKDCIDDIIKENNKDDYVLCSTDAGRAKWVESLGRDFSMKTAYVYKQRVSGSDVKTTGINADVSGKNVIIYDDMIRSGGSLTSAINAYKLAGAKSVFVIASHGVFTKTFFEKDLNCVSQFYCTNSHINALNPYKNLKVIDVSYLFI
jgi:ribose-phosphate pyrophosphokinase